MNPITLVYNEVLFRPLLNLLVFITSSIPAHNVGWAIIIVTLIVRFILLPASIHQARQAQNNQEKMKGIQSRLNKIKKEHKNDRAKQAEATMALYKEAGINPASGCLPLVIQLPILIALYRVFLGGINEQTQQFLYQGVHIPEQLTVTFASVDLAEPSLIFGVVAGIAQFILMKMTVQSTPQPTADEQSAQLVNSMQKNMAYIFPVMTIFFALQFPAALALYWVASTVFAIIQQYALKRIFKGAGALPAV